MLTAMECFYFWDILLCKCFLRTLRAELIISLCGDNSFGSLKPNNMNKH
jgi:hypothetical protein